MSKRGLLMVYSGPSGCGKGTVLQELMAQRTDMVVSISVTTRAPRPGEADGVEYFFRTREEFERLIGENAFLEYAEYSGNYYGTPKAWVEARRDEGKTVVLEIEVQGAQKVMAACPDAVSVFLEPPSMEELARRLRGRGTEAEEVVCRRLQAAEWELTQKEHYRYRVLSDTPAASAARIGAILDAEQAKQNA